MTKQNSSNESAEAKTVTKVAAKSELTAVRIRELLDYDPSSGALRWRVSRGRSKAGSVAGSRDTEGNIQIRIDGRLYMAKELARAHVTGKWPAKAWHNRKRSRQYKKA